MKEKLSGAMLAITLLVSCEPPVQGGTRQSPDPTQPPKHVSDASKGASSLPVEDLGSFNSLVAPEDVLLAHKSMDLTGDNELDAVIVVRHPVPKEPFDYSENPCELRVLHGGRGSYTVSATSTKAVDCTNIDFAKKIATQPDDLNEYLETGPGTITYTNQYTRSTSIYSFNFSKERNTWFLKSATNNYSRDSASGANLENVRETAQFPRDIEWIPMRDFDPRKLEQAFEANRTVD